MLLALPFTAPAPLADLAAAAGEHAIRAGAACLAELHEALDDGVLDYALTAGGGAPVPGALAEAAAVRLLLDAKELASAAAAAAAAAGRRAGGRREDAEGSAAGEPVLLLEELAAATRAGRPLAACVQAAADRLEARLRAESRAAAAASGCDDDFGGAADLSAALASGSGGSGGSLSGAPTARLAGRKRRRPGSGQRGPEGSDSEGAGEGACGGADDSAQRRSSRVRQSAGSDGGVRRSSGGRMDGVPLDLARLLCSSEGESGESESDTEWR